MLERLGQVFRGNEPVAIAIELAVIWAAVFLMLRFLRGTRGAGVLKGVIVILATLILGLRFAETGSDTFARLRFVGEALVGTLALALVVIFQPELRQALIRLGQTGWFRGTDPRFAEMVPAVDEAVEFLSRNQFGALIVIERGVPLSDMTATGVAIDSVVSARLLESVFWPNSPLHDLAVVISGNRIVAANVQLPIADASSVPARLGSRHQAAVGATMETDAVVVVVSEQTGAIRIARHGAISEPIAYDDFALALRTALTAVEDAEHAPQPNGVGMKKQPTWRSEALNMVAAAIIALLVWAYANDRTREAASVSGTLRLSPSDPRVQFVEPATAVTLAVEVRGSRRAIETFEDAVRTGLSLSIGTDGLSADNGSHVVSLKDVLASNPTVAASGAEVVRVRPETLRYEAGALVTEQVPVAAVLPNTAVRGQIAIDPPVVSVTLPEAARKAIGALTVDAAVETRNLEPGKPQKVDVELRLPEALSRWKELCRVVPPRARVSFELLSASSDYTAARVGVRIAMTPDEANRWEVTPEPGSEAITDVTFTGPRAGIDALTSGTFTPAAVVDLGGTAPRIGTGSYAVTFWHLPEGVTITKAGTGGTSPVLNLRVMPREQAPRR